MLKNLLIGALFALPATALAVPVQYALTFDVTESTAPVGDGTGSLVWDSETKTVSDFQWSFAGGYNGGIAGPFTSETEERNGEFIMQAVADTMFAVPVFNGQLRVYEVASGQGPLGATLFSLTNRTDQVGSPFVFSGVAP